MEYNSFGRYDYEELRAAAVSPDATQIDINTLGEWFQTYDMNSWNGEYFDMDDGLRLYPVEEEFLPDQFRVIRYEIR